MSFPIAGPPLTPSSERIALKYKQGVMQSPLSGATTIINNFAEWHVELGFAPQTLAQARKMEAWRNSLQGSVGTFLWSPVGASKPLTGRTLASTAYAMGNALVVTGWAANGASGLVAGDYLSISNTLFQITNAPANADGSGNCTLTVAPQLRKDFAAGSAVEFVAPTCLLRMTGSDDEAAGMSRDIDASYPDAIKAVQAL